MGWFDKLFHKPQGEKNSDEIRVAPIQEHAQPLKGKITPEEDLAPTITLTSQVEEILANFVQTRGALDNFVFFDPEENECFIYEISAEKATLLSRIPVNHWDGMLMNLRACNNRKVAIQGKYYLLFLGVYLSNLGERASVAVTENVGIKDEELVELKRRVIRLINRLKPATALTWKNIDHLMKILDGRKEKTKGDFYQILLEDQVFNQDQIDELKSENNLEAVLHAPASRKMIVKSLAKWLGVEYFDPELTEIDEKLAKTVPRETAVKYIIIPVGKEGETIKVASWNPFDEKTIIKIKELMGNNVSILMSSEEDIRYMLEKIYEE